MPSDAATLLSSRARDCVNRNREIHERGAGSSHSAPPLTPHACTNAMHPCSAGLAKEDVLKVPASMNMTPDLYKYLLHHTREPEVRPLTAIGRHPTRAPSPHAQHASTPCSFSQVLKELRDETAAMNGSHMQITADQGQFLGLLVKLIGARKAVEVGVYTGYSSVAVAMVSRMTRIGHGGSRCVALSTG